jgi:hypothetical protein
VIPVVESVNSSVDRFVTQVLLLICHSWCSLLLKEELNHETNGQCVNDTRTG